MAEPISILCAPACETPVVQPLPGVLPPCAPSCADPQPVAIEPAESIEGAVTRTVATGAGTVAAGAGSVTITNSGDTDGTVLGAAIGAGETISLSAYFDNALNQFVRLPAIAYDGTGTTLSVTRQA